MTVPLDRVRATAAEVARLDSERGGAVAARDAAIAEAFAAGATWAQVQEASGLAPAAVKKALDRHRAAQS